jgi:hypothetical protein
MNILVVFTYEINLFGQDDEHIELKVEKKDRNIAIKMYQEIIKKKKN